MFAIPSKTDKITHNITQKNAQKTHKKMSDMHKKSFSDVLKCTKYTKNIGSKWTFKCLKNAQCAHKMHKIDSVNVEKVSEKLSAQK